MKVENGSRSYKIGPKVADSPGYNLYLCDADDRRQCLFQIAKTTAHNGELDRATFVLSELTHRAEELEEDYKRVRKNPESVLNYNLGFPELVDSFVCHEQGDRHVNVLAFRNVEDVGQMVPLIGITKKDKLRVDIRTSAWILGKLLKLLVFAHSEGISVNNLSGNNILIDPEQHYVLIFDWSKTKVFSGGISEEVRRQEISEVAKAVIVALGGNPETGFFPNDGEEAFVKYTEHLMQLARGSERDAKRAHKNFYELIDGFWRGFYPFTTYPIG